MSHPSIAMEPIIDELEAEWRALAELGASLGERDWEVLTDNPGWTVRDNLAHIIGTELSLAGAKPPDVELTSAEHVRNDIGELNERWIVSRRSCSAAELLEEFIAVTDARLVALRAMTQEDFDAESWTPAGMATFGRFMQIRVFDCWMHEQDIRSALGRPGHLDGPCARESLDEVERSLGFVVGKLGKAPDGARVAFEITGPTERTIRIAVDGRAALVDAFDGDATTTIAVPFEAFMRLIGGRTGGDEALADGTVTVSGDTDVGDRIVRNLGYVI